MNNDESAENSEIFINALDILKLEHTESLLQIGLPQFDSLFCGGIAAGTFLEIVGQSSTGKSQLWLVFFS